MKKIFTSLLSFALFSMGAMAQLTPGLTTEWKKTMADGVVLAAGQKAMAIHNGDLYIPVNAAAQKIDIVSSVDGSIKRTIPVALTSAWALNCIAFTEDGVMLTGSSQIGGTNLFLYKWDIDAGTSTALPAIPIKGRTDFFAVHGNFNGEGYLVGTNAAAPFAGATKGNIAMVGMSNGVFGAADVKEGPIDFGAGSIVTIVDENRFFVGGQNVAKQEYDRTTEKLTAVKGAGSAGANSAYFKFKGYEYFVSGENRFGGLKIFDITEGVAKAELLHTTPDLGTGANGSISAPIAVDVKSDHIMIYVLAANNGMAAYKFVPGKQVNEVTETPVFAPAAGEYTESVSVEITSATVDAEIRYTLDGSEPTETSTLYAGAFELNTLGETTVKAKAWKTGFDASAIAEAVYKVVARPVVADPVFAPVAGEYIESVSVEITSATVDAEIRYTLDGSEPTETSTLYAGAIELTTLGETTIKAKAWKADFTTSAVVEAIYKVVARPVVADPVLTPVTGTYPEKVSVEITTTTAGATIRYTLDGTEPTEDSDIYTAAIEITKTTTIKAKAWLAGATASAVVETTYTITTTGINENAQDAVKVYGLNGQIVVETETAGDNVVVYSLQGKKVTTIVTEQGVNEIPVAAGAYVVKVGTKSVKVTL